jgi:hypothetical protein
MHTVGNWNKDQVEDSEHRCNDQGKWKVEDVANHAIDLFKSRWIVLINDHQRRKHGKNHI